MSIDAESNERASCGIGDASSFCVRSTDGDGSENNSGSSSRRHTMLNVNKSPNECQAVAGSKDAAQLDGSDAKSLYSCHICFDTAVNAVVSMCGHLYCWRCLCHWLQTGDTRCPVCQSAVSQDMLIPIYGRNSVAQVDDGIPSRPMAKRLKPKSPWFRPTFGFSYDFIDFGFSRIPFGSLSPFAYVEDAAVPQQEEEQKLSWILLFIVFLCFAWLILS